jgi:hypothetical protein
MPVKIKLLKNCEVGYEQRLAGAELRVTANKAIELMRSELAELMNDPRNNKDELFICKQIAEEVNSFKKIKEDLKKTKTIKKDGID